MKTVGILMMMMALRMMSMTSDAGRECKKCKRNLSSCKKELMELKKDVDECATKSDNCDINAVCQNTVGSYTCKCKAGYTGNGHTCNDIDECASGIHGCHKSASCTNTAGSYSCSCDPPYTGDGKNCTKQLSEECQNYKSLNSADRKITYTTHHNYCDNDIGPGWYRFEGAAGTRLPTSCTPHYRCGAAATSWLNGEHPSVADGRVSRNVCFSYSGDCCYGPHNVYIEVRNCGPYYVYKFVPPGSCSYRYCGTD